MALLGRAERLGHDIRRLPVTVQRKFGFEAELPLMATAATTKTPGQQLGSYRRPDGRMNKMPYLGAGTNFTVHLDHSAKFKQYITGGPILELVTDPAIDETKDNETKAAQKVQEMADAATAMATEPTTPTLLGSIPGVDYTMEKPGYHFFAGAPEVPGQSAKAYMQATFGVKLGRVTPMLKKFAKRGERKAPEEKDRFKDAATAAAGLTKRVAETTSKDRKQDLAELEGLFTLILNYLIAGRESAEKPLTKNMLGQLYYKTSLANVAKSVSGYGRTLLDDKAWRTYLTGQLIAAGGRATGDPVFLAFKGKEDESSVRLNKITCELFVGSILDGYADFVFEVSKNEYSEEITDTVGGEAAVVVENRKVAPNEGWSPDILERGAQERGMAPDEWPAMAKKYHRMIRAFNAMQ